jgi:hypothetical protein
MIKYFTIQYFPLVSACPPENTLYDCRIVDENYKEVFRKSLDEFEKNAFVAIMNSDTEALLYRTHEKLADACYLKIEKFQNKNIIDATKYP